MKNKYVSFHVDLDSPRKLLEFWGHDDIHVDLDSFYDVAMERALSLFKSCGVPVTFFCVGEEIAKSVKARELIREAFFAGHEIANHTYSHPLGLANFDRTNIRLEIEQCSNIIREITGENPVGFRSPGYSIDDSTLDILEELSFQYDSSAFCSLLNPFLNYYYKLFRKGSNHQEAFASNFYRIPHGPYYPSRNNWKAKGTSREIVEIPIPRTRVLNLPFYNNFHLSLGGFLRKLTIFSMSQPYIVYLFHLIEFVDLNDGIPTELRIHPNVKMEIKEKLKAMQDTIMLMTKNRQVVRTDEFVRHFKDDS